MNFVIRVDSSPSIGTGHLMRCLALARALRKKNASVRFISRDFEGSLSHLAEAQGFSVSKLPRPEKFTSSDSRRFVYHQEESGHTDGGSKGSSQKDPFYANWLGVPWQQDAREVIDRIGGSGPDSAVADEPTDWLIVDHYAIDSRWERTVIEAQAAIGNRLKVLAIDDLADRDHACHLLLDQNFYPNFENRYVSRIPKSCDTLLGPQYVLLRPEFAEARGLANPRNGRVQRLLICFGGVDSTNETLKTLHAIKNLASNTEIDRELAERVKSWKIDVVIGALHPARDQINQFAQEMPNACSVHINTSEMAKLMALADLSIGAAGSMCWERCCMGLPAIALTLAENQLEVAAHLDQQQIHINMGPAERTTSTDLARKIAELSGNSKLVAEMSKRAFGLVDGLGMQRVVERLHRQ